MGFGWWRQQPAPVATDTVLPARFFDDSPVVNPVVLRWMLRFDDVLDPHKLHAALTKLVSREDWRRLAGRFRLNKEGRLELHVPEKFDAVRPAVRFTHIPFDVDIDEHPLTSRLPRPTEGPSVQEGGDVFRDLVEHGTPLPATREDYIYSDEPPLALQVVSFKNATVVSLNFPHCVTDAVGLSALINNWAKVLAGRDDEVAPLVTGDPMSSVGTSEQKSQEKYVLDAKRLVGFGFLVFVLHFIYDIVLGPKIQVRQIFVPAKTLAALREQVTADLKSEPKSGETEEDSAPPFVSDGDILTAWGTKMVGLGLGPRSKRTLLAMNVFELRGRLKDVFVAPFAYVQNAFFVLSTMFPAREAQTLPLGKMALRFRTTLQEQTTEPQINALIREQRISFREAGRPIVFAEPNSMILPFSNWSKAKFFDIDFSPAVIRKGKEAAKRASRIGWPVLFYSCDASSKPNPTYRNVFNILGKDPEGNYWITGMLTPATWAVIQDEFKKM
ncbi:hypothetical protein GQ53DRAFT_750620 [Thozetella sp. PMI_491]|nr:hypothetical protein GQ53DRAFT_750620 [Thozetella sp. PMI_491]